MNKPRPNRQKGLAAQQVSGPEKIHQRILRVGKQLVGMSFMVTAISTVATTAITTYSNTRLENKKIMAAEFGKRIFDFEAAQSSIFMQLAVLDADVLDKNTIDETKKADILRSIVHTQIQLLDIRSKLDETEKAAVSAYDKELGNLVGALKTVSSRKDLKPVLVSAQSLLSLKEALSSQMKAHTALSTF
jgi:hypothetical protein